MKRAASVMLLCVFLASPLLADLQVQVKYETANPWLGVRVYSSDGDKGTLVAGQYRINVSGGAGIIGTPGVIDAFCIDLDDWAPTGTARTYTLTSLDNAPDNTAGPMGPTRAGYLAALLNRYWDEGDWVSPESRTFASRTNPYSQGEVAAALQTAVWEIVDEFNTNPDGWTGDATVVPTEWDVSKGLFHIAGNNNVTAIANEMLYMVSHGVPSGLGNYAAVSNHASNSYYQDYVVRVPIPGAVLLAMLGLSAAGLRLRKRA